MVGMRSSTAVRPVADVPELIAASGGDAYVRAMADPARAAGGWHHEAGAVGWLMPSRHAPGRVALATVGDAEAAADLLHRVATSDGPAIGGVTLPRGGPAHLTSGWSLRPANDWEWFFTESEPPHQEHEAQVRWLDDDADGAEILALLERFSPRHDAEPGQPHVRQWCGIRDGENRLVAAAAHTEYKPGVPFLASVVTDATLRGRGYGAAVTAWITRQLLAAGTGWVTLGMYSDNDVARRLYHRLGYRCDHFFTSGALIRRG
jgi:GNAT superfamily N-acetyltransferase